MLPFNGRFDLVLLCISTLFVSEVACVRVSVSGPFAATATIVLILVFIILCCRFCCDCCRRDENKSQQQQQQQQRSLDIKQIRRQHQGANFGGEFHPVSQLEAQITFHQINRNETDRDMSNTTTSTNCGFALPATQDQTMEKEVGELPAPPSYEALVVGERQTSVQENRDTEVPRQDRQDDSYLP